MMFELVRAFETAKSEKNKFLRFICVNYTKHKLKSVFFKKFDINSIEITKEFLEEFFQIYNCISSEMFGYTNTKYPIVIGTTAEYKYIYISYYDFNIDIKVLNNEFNVEIIDPETNGVTTIHPEMRYLNLSPLRPIILIAIYNYCVAYIYGKNSKLYKKNMDYLNYLYDLHDGILTYSR